MHIILFASLLAKQLKHFGRSTQEAEEAPLLRV